MENPKSAPPLSGEIIEFGRYRLDLWKKVVHCEGKWERLGIPEAVILRALGEATGSVGWPRLAKVLSKYNDMPESEYSHVVIRSYVARLRKKLKKIATDIRNPIASNYRSGYRLL